MSLAILVVVHDLSLGGTERIAVRLANAWVARGHRVTLFCGEKAGPLLTAVSSEVAIVEADPIVPRARHARKALGQALRLFLETACQDAVFIPGNYHWSVIPEIAGAQARIVAQVSAALRKPQRGVIAQWFFRRRTRRLLRRADAVVTLSRTHEDQARSMLGSSPVVTIPLPALPDDDGITPPAPPVGPPLVVGVGRLVPEKGFDLLIRAFAMLDRPAARLAIVGDGPQHAALATLAQELSVADRVELVGYVPDARNWMHQARVFVLSSHHEGFPAVVIEAIAAGRPVIATDCTPAVEIVRDAGGIVVPIKDPVALASALRCVLADPMPDPARISAIAEPYRIGPVADAYLRLFAGTSA